MELLNKSRVRTTEELIKTLIRKLNHFGEIPLLQKYSAMTELLNTPEKNLSVGSRIETWSFLKVRVNTEVGLL